MKAMEKKDEKNDLLTDDNRKMLSNALFVWQHAPQTYIPT